MRKLVSKMTEELMDKTQQMPGTSKWNKITFLFVAMMYLFGINPFAQAVNLPETGQTTCYLA